MSLYEEADGLLETHVTWQDVESEMQKALGTTAKFGKNKKATNIGDMKGLMSRIALIDPDWIGVDEVDQKLPEKFVVKIPSQIAMVNMLKIMNLEITSFYTEEKLKNANDMTRLLHNREVAAYKMLARENNPNVPITKVFGSKAFDRENTLKGFLISEYIDNLQHIGMHESLPFEDLKPVIRSAAAFSAMGEKIDREELKFAGESDYFEILLGSMQDEKTTETRNLMMRNAFPPEYSEKVEKMIEICNKFYMKPEILKNYKKIADFVGHRAVLTHSDLWGSNLLCTREDGKVNLKAIIDWQTVSFTTPGHELARLFVACLSQNDRRGEKLNELLKLYYNTFVEELHGKPVPYTFQQLHDGYNLCFPIMTTFVFPGILMLVERAEVSEEDREVIRSSAMDKMIGMLDDIIEIHEWNIKHYPDFFRVQ